MADPAQAMRVPRALRDAGIAIAIDDFGTGTRRSPTCAAAGGQLKIDRSFVSR